ncbi:hypothetical protein BX600DRAFT_489307 [Xylariales sp. PMI_506]|nr:hypothetical protein BX600DRAFT_489307 [Xylariales sp. PMI_506]
MAPPTIFTDDVIAEQKRDLPILATEDNTKGRTFIVTGANSGLGLEASRHYVRLGAKKVIMAVRNVAAGEAAKADIEATTSTTGVAEVWELDLASYASVVSFAARAEAELERIDALIENAALALDRWSLAEGHETSTTINVYSTFLLGILLLPKLKESAKAGGLPHLVIVTSGVAFVVKDLLMSIKDDPLKHMDNETKPGILGRYPLTKLIEILACRHLADLIPVSKTGVVLNYISPGLCYTNLNTKGSEETRKMVDAQRDQFFGRTAEMGSRTLLASAVLGKDSHGLLNGSCEIQEERVPEWVTDDEGKALQKKIWEDIAKELDIIVPGCVEKALA